MQRKTAIAREPFRQACNALPPTARLGQADPLVADKVTLGVLAGWQVGVPVIDANFTALMVLGTKDPAALLAALLAHPQGRKTLLDPQGTRLAIGVLEAPNGAPPVKTKAHWNGDKLVTETERNVQGSTVTTTYIHSLDPKKMKELTIDKTLLIQHGYQFEGADASFQLLLRRSQPDYKAPFELVAFTADTQRRNGDPADFAGVTVFLASRASDYVTGHTIYADGGFSAT